MGHGTPLDPASEAGGGVSRRYMLDVGIASTRHIAALARNGDCPPCASQCHGHRVFILRAP
jgi:hypothetical protein